MKHIIRIIVILGIILSAPAINADSFGFYFRSGGLGMGMEFRHYDYYDRYSPDFYDSSEIDFYAALSPYGTWVYLDDFDGYVWIPMVPTYWQPYLYGSWTYTRYGWTWVSYEPWGWIPHHYGRWFFHPAYHWIWIPGYVWGPAYVTWGYYGGYYAWAPLPPAHCRYYRHHRHDRYRHGSRYDHNRYYHYEDNSYSETNNTYYNYNYYYNQDATDTGYERWIPNEAWVMVNQQNFMSDNISAVRVRTEQTISIINSQRFKKISHAPKKETIQKVTGKRIPVIAMDETQKIAGGKTIKVVRPTRILKEKENIIRPVQKKLFTEPISRPNRIQESGRTSLKHENRIQSPSPHSLRSRDVYQPKSHYDRPSQIKSNELVYPDSNRTLYRHREKVEPTHPNRLKNKSISKRHPVAPKKTSKPPVQRKKTKKIKPKNPKNKNNIKPKETPLVIFQ